MARLNGWQRLWIFYMALTGVAAGAVGWVASDMLPPKVDYDALAAKFGGTPGPLPRDSELPFTPNGWTAEPRKIVRVDDDKRLLYFPGDMSDEDIALILNRHYPPPAAAVGGRANATTRTQYWTRIAAVWAATGVGLYALGWGTEWVRRGFAEGRP